MNPYLIRTSAGASLLALALCLTPSVRAADSVAKRDAQVADSMARNAGLSARDIIGQDIRSSAGEKLGDIKDLVISPAAGKVVYAVVSSGGVLGVGDKLRAVPFSALRHTDLKSNALTLDLNKAKWDTAPYVRDDDIDLLAATERGKSLYEYYGLDWDRETKAMNSRATVRSDQLLRASSLMGKNVNNAGQKVGDIEDVIVDLSSRRATALIDPDHNYTGSDAKFLVGLDQLIRNPDKKDVYATTLTRGDFERAKPARDDWATVSTGYPYLWNGYTYNRGTGYTAGTPGLARDAAVVREDRTLDRSVSVKHDVAVSDVRHALDRDPVLGDAARRVTLRDEGGKLVLRGTAVSKDLKEKIEDRVENLAKGWKVDNQIEVKSAAE
ncbi:MAG: PRC-barrel domain-containing protein [Opitutus sp.]